MKKLLLASLILINCFGCAGRKQGKSAQDASPQQNVEQESGILSAGNDTEGYSETDATIQENVYRSEPVRVDTVINNFRVRYLIKSNEDLVIYEYAPQNIRDIYADNSLFLNIYYNDIKIIDSVEIRKSDLFAAINADIDNSEFTLCSCRVDNASENEIRISCLVCKPESDYCYDFLLTIDKTGSYHITENEYEHEGWAKILHMEEEDISDTIGKYQISFRIINNGKIFYSNGTAYADKNIILSVKREGVYILHETTFDKTDFTSIINPHVMDEILLWKGKISEVQPGYVVTAVSATVPETDMLYDLRLTIHDDGQVVISGKEIVLEEEQ